MNKYTLLLLSLVLLAPLGIDLYLPTLPQVAAGLDTPVSNIQSTIPLFLLVMGLGQLVTGPLVDNFGRKPVAIAGLTLYIAGSLMAALSCHWPLFLTARIIQGCAVCCTAVVAFSGVRDRLSGDQAARTFGFLNGALNIVPALAPLLGGTLAEFWGWRAPFGFLMFYGLLTGVIIFLFLPETRPHNTLKVPFFPLKQYAAILSNPRFICFSLANAGALGMVLTYVSLAPDVLMEKGGLSPFTFALAFGANGLWIMLVSSVVSFVIRKAGRPFCLLFGSLCMLFAAGMLSGEILFFNEAARQYWLSYMLPVAVAVAGLAFIIGPATSYALEPYQQQAGMASALQGFIQMAGGAGGSLWVLALPLSPQQALTAMMLAGSVLAIIAWYCSHRVKGTLREL
ncbi:MULTISPECIES: multidrug effflux MFS transporter [Tatumella]|uniref:Bcr/CflA family efflux transporter n=1 Tax=Tatumella punctata TaxID=399969 RepID=A0ABW1VIH0_9GAMM|nr:multidrug effflux MFS transporter [Tatumella sp. JGM130]MBS0894096.1 multidrug effflux MFS transporter [Tatumella sp. JGM130]